MIPSATNHKLYIWASPSVDISDERAEWFIEGRFDEPPGDMHFEINVFNGILEVYLYEFSTHPADHIVIVRQNAAVCDLGAFNASFYIQFISRLVGR